MANPKSGSQVALLVVKDGQQGHLTTQLGIRHVPALVTQDGKRLRIDELL